MNNAVRALLPEHHRALLPCLSPPSCLQSHLRCPWTQRPSAPVLKWSLSAARGTSRRRKSHWAAICAAATAARSRPTKKRRGRQRMQATASRLRRRVRRERPSTSRRKRRSRTARAPPDLTPAPGAGSKPTFECGRARSLASFRRLCT
eukprot:1241312-Pleurochrysis_carterae.AAC.6